MDSGGSAFPVVGMQHINGQGLLGVFQQGMTLRDYFAGQMLMGMIASPELLRVVTAQEVLGAEYAARTSTIAYKYADAMLKAREVKQC